MDNRFTIIYGGVRAKSIKEQTDGKVAFDELIAKWEELITQHQAEDFYTKPVRNGDDEWFLGYLTSKPEVFEFWLTDFDGIDHSVSLSLRSISKKTNGENILTDGKCILMETVTAKSMGIDVSSEIGIYGEDSKENFFLTIDKKEFFERVKAVIKSKNSDT